MSMDTLKKRIRIAAGKQPADLVIKNARIVNVFTHQIQEGDIAVSDGMIAAIGEYNGIQEVDAGGLYAIPGLIDSHIHVESSFLTPEEFGRIVVPRGTTTTISDPHEIVNVRGMEALKYMLKAAENTLLDIRYVVPSCVPATQWEDSGAVLDAEQISPEELGREVFDDDPSVAERYEQQAREARLPERVPVKRSVATRMAKNHRIRTDTGIEITFPSEYFENTEFISFIREDDGSISIELHNIGHIENK